MALSLLAAGGLAPFAVHACWLIPYAATFSLPERAPLGLYPGLVAFAALASAGWIGTVWYGGKAAAVYPPVLAVLPTLYGVGYYLLLLLPVWDQPSFLLIDNTPLFWLALWSLVFGVGFLLLQFVRG